MSLPVQNSKIQRTLSPLDTLLPELRLIISRSLRVAPDPEPEELIPYAGQADPKDLPILVAALKQRCRFLLTFNTRHYAPATEEIMVNHQVIL